MAIGVKVRKGSAQVAKARRHFRVRKKVSGTSIRPRLVVTRSSRHVFAQIVDDTKGHTLASASTMEDNFRNSKDDKTRKARLIGQLLADRAKSAGVSAVVFEICSALNEIVFVMPSFSAIKLLRSLDSGRISIPVTTTGIPDFIKN